MRVVAVAALAVLGSCVHLIDPRQAANTDIGLQVWVQVLPVEFSTSDTVSRIRIRVSAKNPGQDTIHVDNGGPTCDVQPDPAPVEVCCTACVSATTTIKSTPDRAVICAERPLSSSSRSKRDPGTSTSP